MQVFTEAISQQQMPYANLFFNCSAVLSHSLYWDLQNFWGVKLQSTQMVLMDFSFHSTGPSFYTFVYFVHFQPFKRYKRATAFKKSNTQFITQHSPLAMSLKSTDCLARTWSQQVITLHRNAQLISIFSRTKKNPFSPTYFGCASLLWRGSSQSNPPSM